MSVAHDYNKSKKWVSADRGGVAANGDVVVECNIGRRQVDPVTGETRSKKAAKINKRIGLTTTNGDDD